MNLLYFSNIACNPDSKSVLNRVDVADSHIKEYFGALGDIELVVIRKESFIVLVKDGDGLEFFRGDYKKGFK